jgi:hypothetical protein
MNQYTIEIRTKIGEEVKTAIIEEGTINKVESILDLGLRHEAQINLLKKVQDEILKLQSVQLAEKLDKCPKCEGGMGKRGYNQSDFHSVFTDHKVKVQRQVCKKCGWKSIPSVKSLFGTSSHPDLIKLQCETGSEHTYRDAQDILNKKSFIKRKINNHEQVHNVVEKVGEYIAQTAENEMVKPVPVAKEIIAQIDGGHIKDKDPNKRSFEAMTAVMYRPESVIKKGQKNVVVSKNCVASALLDDQEYMKKAVLAAAKQQGLSGTTAITALCDGAENCWNIARSLQAHCTSFVGVLDWFHISMKFTNISLPKTQNKKLEKVKWCLWHGNLEKALQKLDDLIKVVKNPSRSIKLRKLKTYIENNQDYLVNYEDRKKHNVPFTSHLAESTVESLINQRCKGQQHMRWTRLGVHKLLQIRAYIASNNWTTGWLEKVSGAFCKPFLATI